MARCCPKVLGYRRPRVFWCVRSFSIPGANHHFIILQPDKNWEIDSTLYWDLYEGEKGQVTDGSGMAPFTTVAGFNCAKDAKKGCLVGEMNQSNDALAAVQGITELTNGGPLRDHEPEFRVSCKIVPTPEGMTDSEFITMILTLYQNYQLNTMQRITVDYNLRNQNCSTFANSILQAAGVTEEQRRSSRRHKGIDWGEHIELPNDVWEDPKHITPD